MKLLSRIIGWVREKAGVVYDKAVYVCDHYTYIVPIALGFCSIVAVVYLFCATVVAMSDMNDAIKSIPKVVQVEMEKTRNVLQEEANSNRAVILNQHEATREELEATKEELQKRMTQAEKERWTNKKTLDGINKKLNEKPKRQKVLGVF